MSDHPAVLAHWNGQVRLYSDFIEGEGSVEESTNIPSHAQLVPYLEQLPREYQYRVLDRENGRPLSHSDEAYAEMLYDCQYGLEVNFVSTNPDYEGYGGCRMILDDENGAVGLCIWVNGCEAQSAPAYFVVSVR